MLLSIEKKKIYWNRLRNVASTDFCPLLTNCAPLAITSQSAVAALAAPSVAGLPPLLFCSLLVEFSLSMMVVARAVTASQLSCEVSRYLPIASGDSGPSHATLYRFLSSYRTGRSRFGILLLNFAALLQWYCRSACHRLCRKAGFVLSSSWIWSFAGIAALRDFLAPTWCYTIWPS